MPWYNALQTVSALLIKLTNNDIVMQYINLFTQSIKFMIESSFQMSIGNTKYAVTWS